MDARRGVSVRDAHGAGAMHAASTRADATLTIATRADAVRADASPEAAA
ncbi:hypothetical protein [Microbacterium hydrothermale]|nr:hypothetical protein [Microbacterium hydrothermale]